jgi:DNA (cytosine-5)-methyltransferase 1
VTAEMVALPDNPQHLIQKGTTLKKLKILDLFSGIGGFSLGLERTGGFETVAFVERDEYASKVLAKNFSGVPIYDDVRTFNADGLGRIDCVTGGYPCQPFSLAGKRLGEEDDRHLWPEMLRIVASTRPRWVIAENVAGHINMGLDQVLSDLESEGYTAGTLVIPACAVDAPHRRDRVWIVANASGEGRTSPRRVQQQPERTKAISPSEAMADLSGLRIQGSEKQESNGGNRQEPRDKQSEGRSAFGAGGSGGPAKWLPEPPVGRVAHGIPRRVDRLKCLGNSVVPQIPELIGNAILQADQE